MVFSGPRLADSLSVLFGINSIFQSEVIQQAVYNK